MSRDLSPKEQMLVKLASKKGTDADLVLLKRIHELEDELEGQFSQMKEELSFLRDLVSPSSQEVKAVLEQTRILIEEFASVERLKGDKGDRGDTIVGPKGDTGDGGYTPIKNVDYFDGRDGKDGKDGVDGKDGKEGKTIPADGEEIKKLKEAQDELRKLISQQQRPPMFSLGSKSPRFLTFSFNGDGAQTVFYLPHEPAGKGLAAWAYYDGQWIQPRVQFNIAGKKFTTTFVAAPSTTIEGFIMLP